MPRQLQPGHTLAACATTLASYASYTSVQSGAWHDTHRAALDQFTPHLVVSHGNTLDNVSCATHRRHLVVVKHTNQRWGGRVILCVRSVCAQLFPPLPQDARPPPCRSWHCNTTEPARCTPGSCRTRRPAGGTACARARPPPRTTACTTDTPGPHTVSYTPVPAPFISAALTWSSLT